MAYLVTKHGYDIIVDNEKFGELFQYPWHVDSDGYARAQINGKRVAMDKYLTNCPKGMRVLHRNFKPLDNRLENLEIVTPSELSKRYNEFHKTRKREYDMSGMYVLPYDTSVQRNEDYDKIKGEIFHV